MTLTRRRSRATQGTGPPSPCRGRRLRIASPETDREDADMGVCPNCGDETERNDYVHPDCHEPYVAHLEAQADAATAAARLQERGQAVARRQAAGLITRAARRADE